MAYIYRPTYTQFDAATGQRVTRTARKWYVEFRDGAGRRRRVKGYTDKRATEQLAARLVREDAQRREGLMPDPRDDPRQALGTYLDEYEKALRARNNSAGYICAMRQQVDAVLAGCRFLLFADLDAERVQAYLATRRRDGLSIGSCNHYLGAVKGFARWLAERLGTGNPLARLRKLNAEVDRRRQRRALSAAEFARLIAATAASLQTTCGFTGADRAMLYLVAGYTGLRASELASLTPNVLSFEGDPPTLTVLANHSKHRREDTVPLMPELAVRLKAWLAGRPTDQPLWPGSWAKNHKAARILRVDLEAAGIPYKDAMGRVCDFHGLRHFYITSLARAGVTLVEAQKLARHSTPILTANFYLHLELTDLARAVQKLPALPPSAAGGQDKSGGTVPPNGQGGTTKGGINTDG